MVRTIHTSSVVDKVGITNTAIAAKLQTPELGNAEISALAKYPATQLAAIYPQRVIGAITNIGMTFFRGFYIGANATVPNQVYLRLQQAANQLRGSECGVITGQ